MMFLPNILFDFFSPSYSPYISATTDHFNKVNMTNVFEKTTLNAISIMQLSLQIGRCSLADPHYKPH